MKFIHYSAQPLIVVYDAAQSGDRIDKPRGLWFSAGDGDDGWRAWCEGEQFSIDCLAYATEITLADNARILNVCGAVEIDDLTMKYGRKYPFRLADERCFDGIHWRAISDLYDAIVIAPYCWDRRLDGIAKWYYSWDCASGCVWNASAVKTVGVSVATNITAREDA